jgi:beta-N-acetylhexosaminidase
VTISDDLEAPAFAPYGGPAGAGMKATQAGVDLLLYARTYAAAAHASDALAAAVRSGAVDRDALEASRRRIEALRASL